MTKDILSNCGLTQPVQQKTKCDHPFANRWFLNWPWFTIQKVSFPQVKSISREWLNNAPREERKWNSSGVWGHGPASVWIKNGVKDEASTGVPNQPLLHSHPCHADAENTYLDTYKQILRAGSFHPTCISRFSLEPSSSSNEHVDSFDLIDRLHEKPRH